MDKGSRVKLGIYSLGELEVDILKAVAKLDSATVKDIFEALYPSRRLAYTTVLTVMGRLTKKGILHQERSQAPYVYTPIIGLEQVAASIVDCVVDQLLDGSPDALVKHLTGKKTLDGASL